MEPFTDQSETTDVSMPEDVTNFLINQANEKISEGFVRKEFSEDDISGKFYREEKGFGYGVITITSGVGRAPDYFAAKYRLEDNGVEKEIEPVDYETIVDEILRSHNLTEAIQNRSSAILHKEEGLIVTVMPDQTNKHRDHHIIIPNENTNPEEKNIYSTPVRASQIK